MPRYTMYRGARFYGYGFSPMRKYRKTYSLRRMSRPARVGGFWPGNRSTFRKVTKYRRIPGIGTIRKTYSIPELKYIDNSDAAAAIDESGTITLLNALSLGTGATQRVGMRITMRSLHLKYIVTGPVYSVANGANAYNQHVRIMLVLDLQPNGATLTLGDLIEDATTGIGIVSSLYMANAARFKVLYDKRMMVTPNVVVPGSTTVQQSYSAVINNTPSKSLYDEIYLKLSHEVQYADSNNGDITDIKTGALFLIAISDNATAAQQPLITSYVRVRYHDN